MPPTRTLNTSRSSDRNQLTGGPRNERLDHSIVQAQSVRTIEVFGEVWSVPDALPECKDDDAALEKWAFMRLAMLGGIMGYRTWNACHHLT